MKKRTAFRTCDCKICYGIGLLTDRRTIRQPKRMYGEFRDILSSEPDDFLYENQQSHEKPHTEFKSKNDITACDGDEEIELEDNSGSDHEHVESSDIELSDNTEEIQNKSARESEDEAFLCDEDINDNEEESLSDSGDEESSQFWSFSYDKKLYSSGIATHVLSGSDQDMTILQWLALNFFQFTCHPGTSKTAFSANLKMQKVLQHNHRDLLPSDYKEARKMINPYLIKKVVFDACINDCVIYRNTSVNTYNDLSKCPVCQEERYYNNNAKRPVSKKKFSYIPLGPRLARIFGETNLAKIVQSHPGSECQILEKGMDMWDIHDSPSWRELYSNEGHFQGDKMGLSFALELDGVNPFHNIGVMYSMTPIMLTLLNFPRHVRNAFGNIMLVGIIPGSKQSEASNLDPYIEILVDELIFLTGCTSYREYEKAPVLVKIKLLLYVLDYPALSKIFRQLGSGALAGCHWCHIRGIHCKHLDKVIYLSNRTYLKSDDLLRKDTTNFIHKWEETGKRPQLRSKASEVKYREAFQSAQNKTQAATIATATGCKGSYALLHLPEHNRLDQSQPDACHTFKDVVQNIIHLITAKNIDVNKIVSAERAFGRLLYDVTDFPSVGIEKQNRKRKTSSKKRNNENTSKIYEATPPFLLSKDEIKTADDRAELIKVPAGFGLKSSRFISKTGSLKSHDWKQLASQGILKFCLRGTLGQEQRKTLFNLLDCFELLCAENQNLDELEKLEEKLDHALALLERDFPLSIQNITTHILHHVIDGIKRFGPVYGTWMFVFERFNSWLCKRSLNMRYPESTAVETYLIYDWCNFMLMSGKLMPHQHLIPSSGTQAFIEDDMEIGAPVLLSQPVGNSYPVTLRSKAVASIHKHCCVDLCQNCVTEKYFYHQEIHQVTKRVVNYGCSQNQKVSDKSVSSYVSYELPKGPQSTKVTSGKFVNFGQIQHFIVHSNTTSKTYFANIGVFDTAQYDEETGLWFVKSVVIDKYIYLPVCKLSPPLVTAFENTLWFINSGKRPFIM